MKEEASQHVEALKNSVCLEEQIARLDVEQLRVLIRQCRIDILATELVLDKLETRFKEL